MKIVEEGAPSDFDRRTGRPQTEKGRKLAPKKKYLGADERSQLDKLTDRYGSYANIPKRFKAQFKENKGINNMVTRQRLEEILREEIAAIAENWPDPNEPSFVPAKANAPAPENKDPWATVADSPFGKPDEYKRKGDADRQKWRDEASVARAVTHSKAGREEREAMPIALEAEEGMPLRFGHMDVDPDDEEPTGPAPEADDGEPHMDPPADDPEDLDLMEMLSLLESPGAHMGQEVGEVPPVENDQRARELLDGFKNMLKPQERSEPSACGTFLRQLAAMADREGDSRVGDMPNPLPNN